MARFLSQTAHRWASKINEMRMVSELSFANYASPPRQSPFSDLVVALTSYPTRIQFAWRSVETILGQDGFLGTTVLVLCESDFPRREVPRRLRNQCSRGLKILWVKRDGRSFDKLLPVRHAYPGSAVITVDDDIYFPNTLVSQLVQAAVHHPGSIVSSRGWRVLPSQRDGQVHFGEGWQRSESGDAGPGLHLPGGNGCFYPPDGLDPVVDDLELALKLAPTNDDIWFWIQAVRAGTEFACLGMRPHLRVGPQTKTDSLSRVNDGVREAQFQDVMRYFSVDPEGLIWRG